MEAKVDVDVDGSAEIWEVELSVWEEGRCIFAAILDDDVHGFEWHVNYAREIARQINEGARK